MPGKIKSIEKFSIGKIIGTKREKNDDGMFDGKNLIGVFDGVSNKSSVIINGKKIRVTDIITDAMKELDEYEQQDIIDMEFCVAYINRYIRSFCDANHIDMDENKMESTGVIYSKHQNQIWLVGDCQAVYDGKTVTNELEIDKLYAEIRGKVIEGLKALGYTEEQLEKEDISQEIVNDPNKAAEYMDKEKAEQIKNYIRRKMREALLECGFQKDEIDDKVKQFYSPKVLQPYLKNNPNVGKYGYSVFDGKKTPMKNCEKVQLPATVKEIRLSTDGVPLEILKKGKDAGAIIRATRRIAKKDPLGINPIEIHGSTMQAPNFNVDTMAWDDSTAAIIKFEPEQEPVVEKNVGDER